MLNRNKKIAIVLAAVLVLVGAIGVIGWYRGSASGHAPHAGAEYFCPMHPTIVRDKPGECPICGMKLEKRAAPGAAAAEPLPMTERRILFYRHPMDPSIHSDTPAKDDMGMDYIPVYADDAGGGSTVEGRAAVKVPVERAQLLGIRSVPVGSGFTGGTVRTVGRVAMDERRREVVHAKYEGYVEKLFVDFTGKPVRRGQPLLAIYSPELVAAQKEYLVARGAQGRLGDSSVPGVARGGADLAEAARQRLRSFDVGPGEIAALEKTGTARRTITLRSPVSGVVMEKTAIEGMKVSPADRLYEIADLSHVWILAEVYEKDLGAVRVGLPARVTLATQPGGEWRGTVTFVSPTVKRDTRTVEARIDVDNVGGVLKPDMFVDVSFEGAPAAVLTIPESAVIPTGERTLVFVDKGEGHYEPRGVALGARVAGGYEVRRGLAAGERVVVSANFLLDSESSIRAAISRTTGGN
jgi:multidrug efflux pump subunit AcrA (membrane-fusion protein)